MASNPDQFLQALIGTTGLAPIQQLQQGQQNLTLGNQQIRGNQLVFDANARKEQEAQQYQTDVQSYFQNPTPQALGQLMAKYPQQAEALKKSNDARDEPARLSRKRELGGLYNSARNKKPELVISSLERLIRSEKAQGLDTSDAESLLADLQDGDEDGAALRNILAFSQGELAATDPAFAKAIGATGEGFTLNQGDARYGPDGSLIAERAPKPEYIVRPYDADIVPINGAPPIGGQASEGGGQAAPSAGGGALTVERLRPHFVAQESGGDYTARNAETGAMGAYQVMPATGQGLAKQLGLPWRPELMAQNTPEARAYQDRIGGAAIQDAIDNSGGDPLTAFKYYYGGSDRSKWGPRTRKYGVEMMRRSGGGSQPQSGERNSVRPGDPAGTIYGKPRRGWTMMTPQEVAATPNLDPALAYQKGPDGQVQPVSGQRQQATRMGAEEVEAEGLPPGIYYRGADGVPRRAGDKPVPLKPVPTPVVDKVMGNRSSIRTIDKTLAELDANPDSVGLVIGNTPNWIARGGLPFGLMGDPKGVDLRAGIADIGGLIIHDRSGAAVTLSEYPRLVPFIPLATDDAATARKKLKRLRTELAAMNADYEAQYSEDQGYRPIAPSASGPQGKAPVRVRSIQEAQKLKPGTLYQAPNGKVYKR